MGEKRIRKLDVDEQIRRSGEYQYFSRLLAIYPSGILSVVSDTWDLWKVLTEYLPKLKDKIVARHGKLVVRPDSGNPADILCGDPLAVSGSPAQKGVIEILWDTFGGTVNSQGYKVLDPHVGAIYGDSITVKLAEEICKRLAEKGFASTNVVFGIGSFTYQYNTRDTFGQAMKATWAQVNGKACDLWKCPVTDSGGKKSAKGRLAVIRNSNGELTLLQGVDAFDSDGGMLSLVWRNGIFYRTQTFDAIRRRLHC